MVVLVDAGHPGQRMERVMGNFWSNLGRLLEVGVETASDAFVKAEERHRSLRTKLDTYGYGALTIEEYRFLTRFESTFGLEKRDEPPVGDNASARTIPDEEVKSAVARAEAAKESAEQAYQRYVARTVGTRPAKATPCSRCADKGVIVCDTCNGRKWRRRVVDERDRYGPYTRVTSEQCRHCHGRGWNRCPSACPSSKRGAALRPY